MLLSCERIITTANGLRPRRGRSLRRHRRKHYQDFHPLLPVTCAAKTAALIDRPVHPWRLVMWLAWPVLIQQLLIWIVNRSDGFLAGYFQPGEGAHTAYQSAQTNAMYLSWAISSCTVLVGAGGTALVAKLAPVEVELVTLDGLVDSGVIDKQRVGMVWIDAEGHEGHILEGGAGLLENGVAVVFEFHPAGLQERGDRNQIHAIAEDAYTHFVDVRRQEVGQPRFQLHPVSARGHNCRYGHQRRDAATD